MKVSVKPVERTLVIELSEDEASALMAICRHVGGSSHCSARGYFDRSDFHGAGLLQQLEEADVEEHHQNVCTGIITFEKD